LGIVGSARYDSPEKCVQDVIMDEITNIYTMGATAFALFAHGDRSPEAWTLSAERYAVVKKRSAMIATSASNRLNRIEPYKTVLSGDDECILTIKIGRTEENA